MPKKSEPKEDEVIVQEAMKERGVLGGCWNVIMRGGLPSQTEEGFRTLEACALTKSPFVVSIVSLASGFERPPKAQALTTVVIDVSTELLSSRDQLTLKLLLYMCTVVAGLALHFDSTMIGQGDAATGTKSAFWQVFQNLKLSNSKNLSIGHCTTSAPVRSQRDQAKKVTILAGKDSILWRLQSMYGMAASREESASQA